MQSKRQQLGNLYKRYARSLYFYLLRLCDSKQLAEDLTQETFVRATIHLHTYEEEEARAWLFKVARNAYLDEWRKQQKRRSIPFLSAFSVKKEMISPYGLPEESILTEERNEQLEELLKYLPEHYHSIIYLREYEEFSYKEISEALQLTVDQVKITLHRARKRLATIADKEGWQ